MLSVILVTCTQVLGQANSCNCTKTICRMTHRWWTCRWVNPTPLPAQVEVGPMFGDGTTTDSVLGTPSCVTRLLCEMLSLAWLTCPSSRNKACCLTKKRSQWGVTKLLPVKIVVSCSSKMQALMIWLFGEETSVASSDLVITATYISPLGWASSPSNSSRSIALLQEAIWR